MGDGVMPAASSAGHRFPLALLPSCPCRARVDSQAETSLISVAGGMSHQLLHQQLQQAGKRFGRLTTAASSLGTGHGGPRVRTTSYGD